MIHAAKEIKSTAFYDDWDRIDPDSLRPVVGRRTMTMEFGYLLRHYWIPASVLRFQETTLQRKRGSTVHTSAGIVEQEMVRCDADCCIWREKTVTTDGRIDCLFRLAPICTEKRVCTYNRSTQSFQVRVPRTPKTEASRSMDPRVHAMFHQPVLTPLLPVPIGFQWHVERNRDGQTGHIDFTLESAVEWNGATILFIRKEGEFELDHYFHGDRFFDQRFRVRRKGMTAYALDESVVLEDRVLDEFLPHSADSQLEKLEIMTVRKLLPRQD